DAVIEKARGVDDRPVVIDFRCDPGENCYPMVAAGTSNDDIILGPGFETDHETHGDTLSSQDPPHEDSCSAPLQSWPSTIDACSCRCPASCDATTTALQSGL